MAVVLLLSDRSTAQALPALEELRPDLKHVPLALSAIGHALELQPDVLLVDAGENPGQAWSVLTELKDRGAHARTIVIVERPDLGRYPWHELADEFVYPGAPETELEVRFAMLRHRAGSGDGSIVNLGELADRHRHLQGHGERPSARPHLQRVRAPAVPRDPCRSRLHPAGAPSRGMGLRLLRGHPDRGRARQAAAGQARRRARAPDRDRAVGRLPGTRPGLSHSAYLGASRPMT